MRENIKNISDDSYGEAKDLAYSSLHYFEGMSEDEWINRDIVPTDFEVLDKESRELMRAIKNRLHSV